MQPVGVVKRFDVVCDGGSCFTEGRPGASVDKVFFQGRKEALDDGIVPTVASAAHAAADARVTEHRAVGVARILTAPV